MEFTKMQGAGNDFIILNNMDNKIPFSSLPSLAKHLCTRKMSIGADGFMVLVPSDQGADFKMLFYNSDGSVGEMCGNGARCICRYAYENGLSGEKQSVETTAGIVYGERITSREYRIRLNDPTLVETNKKIQIDDKEYTVDYIELGDPSIPHCVVTMDDPSELDYPALAVLGSKIRYYNGFPKGANVSFTAVQSRNHVIAATFERGVEDFTLACGTGCGSIVTAHALNDRTESENVTVSMPGGDLHVSVNLDGPLPHDLYLTGPTNIVCTGTVTDEDLNI
ncbi:MAG: diaminopimelate epimerase [Oscillospiraceae bacterium]|nr:diaminopimelate epimerase [Oscillospiraceae bacterium]